jgi:tape measure domain-containing protein
MADKTEYIISLKDLFSAGIKDADKSAKGLDSTVASLKTTIAGLAATVGFSVLAKDIFDTTLKMDSLKNSLNFISGGQGKATFEYLRKESDKLGLSLEASANGYKQIAGAARGTNLEGQKTKDIFEGVSAATAVMGLSSEQSEGALLALSQMISKGKVQAEELRGQLGERIPGAFQIAARAMNMTTKELDKFMSDGKLIAEDFLPKFAKQLKEEFSSGIPAATQSLAAVTNRLKNEYSLLKMEVGNELRPVMFWLIQSLRDLIPITREVIKFLKDHKDAIKNLAQAVAWAAGTFFGLKLAIWAVKRIGDILFIWDMVKYIASTQGLSRATAFMTAMQWDLNAAMAANPVGAVALAVGALVLGIKALIDNYDKLKQEYQDTIEKNHARAIQDEIKYVNDLAKSYEKYGFSVEESKKRAYAAEVKQNNLELIQQQATLDKIKKQREEAMILDKGDFDEKIRVATQTLGVTTAKRNALMDIKNSFLAGNAAGKGANIKVDTGTDKVKGPEHKVITINIDKLVEKLSINTTNMIEGAAQTKEMMVKALLEALNDAQIINPI